MPEPEHSVPRHNEREHGVPHHAPRAANAFLTGALTAMTLVLASAGMQVLILGGAFLYYETFPLAGLAGGIAATLARHGIGRPGMAGLALAALASALAGAGGMALYALMDRLRDQLRGLPLRPVGEALSRFFETAEYALTDLMVIVVPALAVGLAAHAILRRRAHRG